MKCFRCGSPYIAFVVYIGNDDRDGLGACYTCLSSTLAEDVINLVWKTKWDPNKQHEDM
jgi:hypothetical protein